MEGKAEIISVFGEADGRRRNLLTGFIDEVRACCGAGNIPAHFFLAASVLCSSIADPRQPDLPRAGTVLGVPKREATNI
jgi:hypothetical protein